MVTSTELAALQVVAGNLGVNPDDLYKLISFESNWNPQAKNPRSGARGLLQFTNDTARSLGFMDSLDLTSHNPTILDQLPIVQRYLLKFKPFPSKQSLYMAVFYPKARSWNPGTLFPEVVRRYNPGINTVADYIAKVDRTKGGGAVVTLALVVVGYLIYKLLSGKGGVFYGA